MLAPLLLAMLARLPYVQATASRDFRSLSLPIDSAGVLFAGRIDGNVPTAVDGQGTPFPRLKRLDTDVAIGREREPAAGIVSHGTAGQRQQAAARACVENDSGDARLRLVPVAEMKW